MRLAAVGAGGHDGIKGIFLCAVLHLKVGESGGQLCFLYPGTNVIENLSKGPVCDLLSLFHQKKFSLILGLPKGGEKS